MADEVKFRAERSWGLILNCSLELLASVLLVALPPTCFVWLARTGPEAHQLRGYVTAAVAGLVYLALAVRAWRSGRMLAPLALGSVTVGPEGVRAEGPWYRKSFRWDEITRVDVAAQEPERDVVLDMEVSADKRVLQIPRWVGGRDRLLLQILARTGMREPTHMPFGIRYERAG